MVDDVVQQVAVLAQPAAVADPMRAASVQRLRDRGRAVRLPRVDRDVDVVLAHEAEGVEMLLGRVVVLGAGQVETDNAAVFVRDHQLGHFE